MSKIAIYLRLSKEDRGNAIESESISNQRDYIYAYIANEASLDGYEVFEYADDGYSGTNANRPAYQRLLEDIKRKYIDSIIVKDMSRFSRDYIELGNFLENIFPFMGIRFIAINDSYDSLGDRCNGTELDTQFKSLLYDFYSKDMSEKIRANILELKSQGKNIDSVPPFGYIKDPKNRHKIIIDKETAPIVKEAFDLICEGFSCREIARKFNENNYITGAERKERLRLGKCPHNYEEGTEVKKIIWNGAGISALTRNEIYTGDYVYNKRRESRIGGRKITLLPESEWKIIKNAHEPIVSREVFEKAKKIKESRKGVVQKTKSGKNAVNKSILCRKVYCKECAIVMMFRYNCVKRKKGVSEYRKFYCYLCKERQVYNNQSEKKILDIIRLKMKDYTLKADEGGKINRSIPNSRNYDMDMEELNKILRKLYEEYKQGKMTKEAYLKEKDKVNQDKTNLAKEKEDYEQRKSSYIKLPEGNILKYFIDKYVDRVVASRYGEIVVKIKDDVK